MTSSDRPLYEDLLKQRNDLEALVRQIAAQTPFPDVWLADLDKIIGETRRQEGLT